MKSWSRRQFIEAAAAGLASTPLFASGMTASDASDKRSVVYWTPEISPESLQRMYALVSGNIKGKVALKLHTGEPKGPNILPPAWIKQLQAQIPQSTIVECNVLYKSPRQTTAGHRKVLVENGWTFSPVDIMDEEGDAPLPIKGGLHLKELMVGKHFFNYDSMVVLTHFKGHPRGGFGGSMKNLAIGCADGQIGKRMVHGVGKVLPKTAAEWPGEEPFMENMAESAKATIDYFGKHIVYLNVMHRMSVDCDCTGTAAAEPTIPDIGILASTDLLAIDQASVDLVYEQPEVYRHDLVERIESRKGLHQLQAMRDLKMGNPVYELISID